MQTHVNKGQARPRRAVAARWAVTKHGSSSPVTLADNRPEAIQLQKLQSMADNSPQAASIARLQAMADGSPDSVAQRLRLEGASGGPLQRQEMEEKDLQMKAAPGVLQRQGEGPVQRKVEGFASMRDVAQDDDMWEFYVSLDNPSREEFKKWLSEDFDVKLWRLAEFLHPNFENRDITWRSTGSRIEAHISWGDTEAAIRERPDEIRRYQFDKSRGQWVYQLTWPRIYLEEFSGKSRNWSWKDGHILFSFDLLTATAFVFHSGPGG